MRYFSYKFSKLAKRWRALRHPTPS